MKQKLIKTVAMLLLLSGVSISFASPDHPQQERIENVRSQIFHRLENPDLTNTEFASVEATLHFIINKESEIVVVYVDAQEEFVDQYLKTRLNYQKIKNNILRGPYSMKITIKNGSIS